MKCGGYSNRGEMNSKFMDKLNLKQSHRMTYLYKIYRLGYVPVVHHQIHNGGITEHDLRN